MLVAAIRYTQEQNEPSYPQMLELGCERPVTREGAEAAVREYFGKSPIAKFEWFGSYGDLEAEFADGEAKDEAGYGDYVLIGFPKDVRDSLKG